MGLLDVMDGVLAYPCAKVSRHKEVELEARRWG